MTPMVIYSFEPGIIYLLFIEVIIYRNDMNIFCLNNDVTKYFCYSSEIYSVLWEPSSKACENKSCNTLLYVHILVNFNGV